MTIFLLSLIIFMIFSLYKSSKALQMLQQNYYDESHRYLLWMTKNFKKVFLSIDLLGLSVILFFIIPLTEEIMTLIFIFLYLVIFLLYRNMQKKESVKIPLAKTARIKRMYVTEIILYGIIIAIMACSYVASLLPLYYLLLVLMTYLSYLVILAVNYINKPVEKLVYLHYKKEALKKLKKMNIPVIGITGSYGKTSSKNIINEILNVKYNSFATPKNFNTTYGMINSINNYLDKFNDLFIAEMGAFKRGEIKKTCDLMHPKYGVLTTIGEAHLESFGSKENIQKGKFELIESLPSNGIAILNGDDEYQQSYDLQNKKCKVLWYGIDSDDVDVRALNIKLSCDGTTFDVKFKGDDNSYSFHTRLLGKHNVYNLLAGILLGKELGLTIDELKRGVGLVKTIDHRLQLKKMGTLNIIDDAYNSNPVGSKTALDVLKLMPGTHTIVTPGMIELGPKQYEYNKRLGVMIAAVCDYVILVGKEQTKPIFDGLKEKGYNEDNIFIVNDVTEAFKVLRRLDDGNMYALLENDLPDLFNE